jgi:hypothetical protein
MRLVVPDVKCFASEIEKVLPGCIPLGPRRAPHVLEIGSQIEDIIPLAFQSPPSNVRQGPVYPVFQFPDLRIQFF